MLRPRALIELFIFILLGGRLDFVQMAQHSEGSVAVLPLILMFVARPLTVFLCALPDRRARWRLRSFVFMCWTHETGVHSGRARRLLLGRTRPRKLI